MTVIEFYFDFISPYAYLSWTQVHALAGRHGAKVVPKPVLFAALLGHHGHKGPAEIASKRVFTGKDMVRKAHRLGVPLSLPPSHPFNPLTALRVAGCLTDPETQRTAIEALYCAVWRDGVGVESDDVIQRALDGAGLDGATLLAQARTPGAKQRLRSETEAAIARGVFGVPTLFVGDELFWGVDTHPDLEAYLRGEDPASDLQGWDQLPSSAQRSR